MTAEIDDTNLLDKRRRHGSVQAYHPLAVCLLFIATGILVDYCFCISLRIWIISCFISLGGWLFCFIKRPNDGKGFHRTHLFILCGLFCTFGVWHHYYWNCFAEDDIGFFASVNSHPVCVRGTIVESAIRVPAPPLDPGQPLATPDRMEFVIRVSEIRDGQTWIQASGKAAVYVSGSAPLPNYGDQLKIFGTLYAPGAAKNPNMSDAKTRFKRRRIRAIIQVASSDAFVVERQNRFSPFRWQESLRRNAQRNLHKYMDRSTSPLATAMILGFREDVPEETTQTLLETGTMHILAISGLHIGLIAGALAIMLRFLGLSSRGVALGLMMIVLFYFSLTDMRPPAFRATLLICVACVGVLVRQKPISLNALAFTAIIVLIRNPTDMFQFGTQLSFLITSVFVWFPSYTRIEKRFFKFFSPGFPQPEELSRLQKLQKESLDATPKTLFFATCKMFFFQVAKQLVRLSGKIVLLFILSGVIFLISLPLILDRIHLLTPVAMLVNPFLWVPLTGALLCGFATMVFAWIFPPLAVLFGQCGNFAFRCLEQMLHFFHRIPYGYWWSPGPPKWWLYGYYLPIVFLTLFPQMRPRARWIVSYFVLWTFVGYTGGYVRDEERLRADRLTVTVLSVGHGTSVLIQTPDAKSVIYDAGCFSRPIISANALSQCLWRAGKTHIDAIVLSHPDTDHFNAVPELAKRFDIGAIYVSQYMFDKFTPAVLHLRSTIEKRGIPLHVVHYGNLLELNSKSNLPEFSFLHPPVKIDTSNSTMKPEVEANATSLVLLLRHRGVNYLFPGDLDSKRNTVTVEFLRSEPIRCDTIMVPHHGGNSNFTEPLICWCEPASLLISGGKFTYRPEISQQFRERGMNVYHTFEDGFIRLTSDKNGQKIETPLSR